MFASHRYLILEALPSKAQQVAEEWEESPQRCRNELSTPSYKIQGFEKLSWWPAFEEMGSEVTLLAKEIDSWSDQTAQGCLAHGDFTRANMCQSGGSICLFDWEDSAPDGPVMTDEVRFFLERRSRSLMSRPDYVAALVGRQFLSVANDETRRNLALALAFLCSRGNASGIIMGQHWLQITEFQIKA